MIRRLQIVFALLWLTRPVLAQTPNFSYPYLIPIPAVISSFNEFAVPCVGDWMTTATRPAHGVMYDGYVIFYENIATGMLPQFASGVLIEAMGSRFRSAMLMPGRGSTDGGLE